MNSDIIMDYDVLNQRHHIYSKLTARFTIGSRTLASLQTKRKITLGGTEGFYVERAAHCTILFSKNEMGESTATSKPGVQGKRLLPPFLIRTRPFIFLRLLYRVCNCRADLRTGAFNCVRVERWVD